MGRKIQFTETVLRDAGQSLLATRLPFERFEGILKTIDEAGYYSAECWGGATFDVCLRYLNEDPWERLRKIRKAMPNTKLQMLLRGQNLLGYKHYPDDIVRKFIEESVKNGIDIIRIFDALNDVRNIEVAVDETLKQGAIASGALCYTISPVHTLKKFVETAKAMASLGCQSICIKDMAGIMSPQAAYMLVTALKESVDLPIIIHTHCTTGLAYMTLLKAVEAGADVIDTAISPLSGGTSQPATETMAYTLREMGYEVDLNSEKTTEIADYFKKVRDEYVKNGILMPKSLTTDTQCLNYQIPGGMISNLLSQLQMFHALDKFDAALEETPKVRADMGYPPLVTPLSQMVGTQAVLNVLFGERYKNVVKEVKNYFAGEYGASPAPVDPEIEKQILGSRQKTEGRFADTLELQFESLKQKYHDIAETDEDVLSCALFPEEAEKYLLSKEK